MKKVLSALLLVGSSLIIARQPVCYDVDVAACCKSASHGQEVMMVEGVEYVCKVCVEPSEQDDACADVCVCLCQDDCEVATCKKMMKYDTPEVMQLDCSDCSVMCQVTVRSTDKKSAKCDVSVCMSETQCEQMMCDACPNK